MPAIDPTIAQIDELAFRLVFGFVCFFAGAVIVGGLIWGERTLALTFWRAEFERVLRMTTQNVESPHRQFKPAPLGTITLPKQPSFWRRMLRKERENAGAEGPGGKAKSAGDR